MVIWKAPKVNVDAVRIKSLDRLHKILQVINDPQSLTALRDSFRQMRAFLRDDHPLHDADEGFRNAHAAIQVRAKELQFTFSANRFHAKRT